MVRGDVEAALWDGTAGSEQGDDPVEVRFSTTPAEITEGDGAARVLLEDDSTGTRYRESFDLAIGADGLRSGVRRLAFGPQEEFMTTWSAMICAFPLPVQAPSFTTQDSLISARTGRADCGCSAWPTGPPPHF